MKGKEKVLGEVGLEFIGYNQTRCVSILGIGELVKALKKCCLANLIVLKGLILSHFKQLFFENYGTLNNEAQKISPRHRYDMKFESYIYNNNFLNNSFCTDSRCVA